LKKMKKSRFIHRGGRGGRKWLSGVVGLTNAKMQRGPWLTKKKDQETLLIGGAAIERLRTEALGKKKS